MLNFGLIGAAGYIAPRHIKAIRDTGNELVCATDPHDSVGVLDRYFMNVRYFQEIERFDRFLEKRRRGPTDQHIDYISICTPNYLHDAHIRMALRVNAHALCEKPIVINPWNLDALQQLEEEYDTNIFTVLQLRVHPALVALREHLHQTLKDKRHQVELTYITSRGPWYHGSWKGREEKSGGLVLNIGIHFFDLLIWLFGNPALSEVHLRSEEKAAGYLELKHADVRWFLSIDTADLPFDPEPGIRTTYRSIKIDDKEIEFTEGFTDLHTKVYETTLEGHGFRLSDARPSLELVYLIRTSPPVPSLDTGHPFLMPWRGRR
ncbi:Gfo/Idh/MocA family oxidoreductase [bacterium]|nr:Gfo/Idh/MocA family oxidoreductase [candidate division CSSED10-310 bacterium]